MKTQHLYNEAAAGSGSRGAPVAPLVGEPRVASRGPGGFVAKAGTLCYVAPENSARTLLKAPRFIGIIDARAARRRLEARSMRQQAKTHGGGRAASIGAQESGAQE